MKGFFCQIESCVQAVYLSPFLSQQQFDYTDHYSNRRRCAHKATKAPLLSTPPFPPPPKKTKDSIIQRRDGEPPLYLLFSLSCLQGLGCYPADSKKNPISPSAPAVRKKIKIASITIRSSFRGLGKKKKRGKLISPHKLRGNISERKTANYPDYFFPLFSRKNKVTVSIGLEEGGG